MTATMTRTKSKKKDKAEKPAKVDTNPETPRTVESVRAQIDVLKTAIKELEWSATSDAKEAAMQARIEELERDLVVLQAQAIPSARLEIAAPERLSIDLELIDVGGNHRDPQAVNPAAVIERAKSMEAVGQLQPIALKRNGKRFDLIFGATRLAAAKSLGWPTIDARVYHEGIAGSEFSAIRAAENVQREGLNFLEEGLAVAEVVDRLKAEGVTEESALILKAAESLGKGESWIRDRVYVSRLSGTARALVISGRLPLGQAREISKLVDPSVQDSVADMVARSQDGTGGWSLDRTRKHVNEQLLSLKVVPWPLDAEFPSDAKIVGPCVACPFNTANDRNLFEHDAAKTGEELAGKCTNQSCFTRKTEVTQAALEKSVKAAVKLRKSKGDATPTEPPPSFVKETTYKRKLKAAMEPDSNKKVSAKRGRAAAQEKSPEEIAQSKLEDAEWKWRQATKEKLSKAFKKSPERLVMGMMLNASQFFRNLLEDDPKAPARVALPAFKNLMKVLKKPAWGDVLEVAAGIQYFELDVYNTIPSAVDAIAKAVDVKIDPAPKLEDFLSKKDAAAAKKSGNDDAKPEETDDDE